MKQCYTENNLIQLIYGECDLFERLEMEDAMREDLCLRSNYDEISKSCRMMPKVSFAPETKTISSILRYSGEHLQATC